MAENEQTENPPLRAAHPAFAMRRNLGRNVRHVRRNYRLGLLDGALLGMAGDFLHPELILAGFIYVQTGSALAVALVTAIQKSGAMFVQFAAGVWIEPFPRRRPLYMAVSALRLLAVLTLGAAMLRLSRYPSSSAMVLFYLALFLHAGSGGALAVIRNDMIGRLIPPHRIGPLLGTRKFLGGVAAVLTGGLVIQPILSRLNYPRNYLTLVAVGALVLLAEAYAWCACREQPGQRVRQRASLPQAFRRGFHWLRTDRNYRRFMWVRISFRCSYVGMAFFIPFGSETLGADGGGLAVMGGILVVVRKTSELAASLLWARTGQYSGYRFALLGSTIATLGGPLLALLAALLPPVFSVDMPGVALPLTLPLLLFLLALASFGAGFSGMLIAGQQFLITNAPPQNRPSYMTFINTLLSPLTLLPLLGAGLAALVGMRALFVLVVAGAAVGVFAARGMEEAPSRRSAAD